MAVGDSVWELLKEKRFRATCGASANISCPVVAGAPGAQAGGVLCVCVGV